MNEWFTHVSRGPTGRQPSCNVVAQQFPITFKMVGYFSVRPRTIFINTCVSNRNSRSCRFCIRSCFCVFQIYNILTVDSICTSRRSTGTASSGCTSTVYGALQEQSSSCWIHCSSVHCLSSKYYAVNSVCQGLTLQLQVPRHGMFTCYWVLLVTFMDVMCRQNLLPQMC